MTSDFLLSVYDHDRARLGRRYVYAVFSRRAGGLSVGVNLNPNNACNWSCVYCQVPNLRRGAAPRIDVSVLYRELREVVEEVVHGSFLVRHLPPGAQVFHDIAISGNGEPTTAREFLEVVRTIGRVRREVGVGPGVRTVLITNGSMVHRPGVQQGLEELAGVCGEVWFKLDAGSDETLRRLHRVRWTLEKSLQRLRVAASRCPTWIQSCWFTDDAGYPSPEDVDNYVRAVMRVVREGIPIQGVHLYTIARVPRQPGQGRQLRPVEKGWLDALAARLGSLGVSVRVVA